MVALGILIPSVQVRALAGQFVIMINSPRTDFTVAAVHEAALLVQQIQHELVSPALTKEDRSPVTVADFAAQAVIAKRLADQFPEEVLIGEESAAALQTESGRTLLPAVTQFVQRCFPEATDALVLEWIDRGTGDPPKSFWTLDPVDGTKGFLRGDQYAVALARIDTGRVEVGAVGCPELDIIHADAHRGRGTVAVAEVGQGAFYTTLDQQRAWQRLSVSDRTSPVDARLLRSVESAHTNSGAIGELIAVLGIGAPPVPMDSQAKYAVLAAGEGDVLLRLLSSSRPDYREMIWDQAAGSIIVAEAGGRVTDLDGKPLDFAHGRTLATNRGVLATNKKLHDAILQGLGQIGA